MNMIKYFIFATILVTTFFGTGLTAFAGIINHGIYNLDEETNLEWLDLTVTKSVAYDDVITTTSGIDGSQWRVATEDQVQNLLNNFFSIIPNIGTTTESIGLACVSGREPCRTQYPSAYFDLMLSWFDIFGSWKGSGYDDYSNGAYLANDTGYEHATVKRGYDMYETSYLRTTNYGDGNQYRTNDFSGQASSSVGWFMVRDLPEPEPENVNSNVITSVPEPSVLALMGLGLSGVVAVRRRKVQH